MPQRDDTANEPDPCHKSANMDTERAPNEIEYDHQA